MIYKEMNVAEFSAIAQEINKTSRGYGIVSSEAKEVQARYPLVTSLWRNDPPPDDPPAWEGLEYIRWAIAHRDYLSRDELFSLIEMGLNLPSPWEVEESYSQDFHVYAPGMDIPQSKGFYAWYVDEEAKRIYHLGLTLQYNSHTLAVAKSIILSSKYKVIFSEKEITSHYGKKIADGKYAIYSNMVSALP